MVVVQRTAVSTLYNSGEYLVVLWSPRSESRTLAHQAGDRCTDIICTDIIQHCIQHYVCTTVCGSGVFEVECACKLTVVNMQGQNGSG